MDIHTLLDQLFPLNHEVKFDGSYFSGTGHTAERRCRHHWDNRRRAHWSRTCLSHGG